MFLALLYTFTGRTPKLLRPVMGNKWPFVPINKVTQLKKPHACDGKQNEANAKTTLAVLICLLDCDATIHPLWRYFTSVTKNQQNSTQTSKKHLNFNDS